MTDDLDLSSLLASRICHDLVSPVGAIVNGTDLIREIGGGEVHEEILMISQSATRASALLQFYRIAFGAAADGDTTLSRGALETQAAQMLATAKIDLAWEGLGGPPMTRPEGRLLFQLLMCARAITGMRGRIVVNLDLVESFPVTLNVLALGTVPGTQSMNGDALRLLGCRPEDGNVTARHIEFALVHRSAQELGVAVVATPHGDGARIEVRRK